MGQAGPLIAIADSGPLIHLAEIEALSALRVLERLHIPDAVWEETIGPAFETTSGTV